MKLTKSWGMIALAAWLIVTGLGAFVPALKGGIIETVLAVVAIAAGVLILIGK